MRLLVGLPRCAKSWDHFIGNNSLTRLKRNVLTWDDFFDSVAMFGKTVTSPVMLAFDEIQWIAREKSGFLGALYYVKDFYLNFYFRILAKSRNKILRHSNESQIFAQLLAASPHQLYLSDYTGPMFELLVQHILEYSVERKEMIFKKLHLENIEFEIGFHWDRQVQFDLIVHNTSDRVYRFIECKWTKDAQQILSCIEFFEQRTKDFASAAQRAVCLNHEPTQAILAAAKKSGVIVITPADLI